MRFLPVVALVVVVAISACVSTAVPPRSQTSDTDAVRQFLARVATEITARGPAAWGDFFDDSPNFFMASEGKVVFASGAAAREALKGLTHQITSIELRWGTELRIEQLAPGLAMVAVPWHEVRVDAGRKVEEDGYFTAVAESTPGGWRFRNAHWSVATPPPRIP